MLTLACAFGSAAALAQAFPTKPVRMIVGFAPGGGTDLAARLVANALGEAWNANVIVDNRPGGGGLLGTELTAKAYPDGHTLMLCNIGSHAITPARQKNLPFDVLKDFAFASMIGGTPNVFVVTNAFPARTLGEFISYARANPGKVSFGSSGVGASPHLSIELMKTMTGIDIVHVPYKGAAPALADAMGGQIPASVGNLPGGPLAAIKSGKVRALAVTTAKRSPQLPDVPSFSETIPGYEVTGWYGICTQSAVPKPILAKMNADLNRVLKGPDLARRLSDQGIDVAPSTQEEFRAYVVAEIAKWTKVVKEAGLTGDQ
jgi:tripartite-type tricarboxylate transporter receptor subunit TctC